ncbi:hypothetical protein J6590_103127, partial [Homalodisca vitripennis]
RYFSFPWTHRGRDKVAVLRECQQEVEELEDNLRLLRAELKRARNINIRDHFWLVYTFQLNLPLDTVKTDVSLTCVTNLCNLVDVQERHLTNREFRDYGVQGQFYRSSLLQKMTVGVGGVCFLTLKVLASVNKGVPPPVCFVWRAWFRAALPFFRET